MRGIVAVALIAGALGACGGSDATGSTTTSQAPVTATGSTTTTAAVTSTTVAATTTIAATTTTAGPATYRITVTAGSVDGPDTIEASVGDVVVIEVSADVTDEVHLHGYDVFADVAPGAPARLEVVTDIPGIFEMELEGARLVLAELEVR